MIKLFELETPVASVAAQLGVAHNTAAKAINAIRRAILAHALDVGHLVESGAVLGDDAGFIEPPVFGIIEHGGWAFVDVAPGLTPESITFFKLHFYLKTRHIGNIIYTDKYQHYDALIYCGEKLTKAEGMKHIAKGLHVDSARGFWAFAKDRLRRNRGVSAKWFPYYLKELEFRYNHRDQDIFEMVARFLCSFVPNIA